MHNIQKRKCELKSNSIFYWKAACNGLDGEQNYKRNLLSVS